MLWARGGLEAAPEPTGPARPGPAPPSALAPSCHTLSLFRPPRSYYFAIFSNMTRVSSSVKGRIFPLLGHRILVPQSPEEEVSRALPSNPKARSLLVPHASAAESETIETGSAPLWLPVLDSEAAPSLGRKGK